MSHDRYLKNLLSHGNPLNVANRLLGCLLVRQIEGQRLSGIIVEVEAYLACNDPASHSARGITRRNSSMFGPPGTWYVYSIHRQHCLNFVTQSIDVGSAILIRALEPWEGLEGMSQHRGLALAENISERNRWLRALTSGPGRLCESLAVNLQFDGLDSRVNKILWIEPRPQIVQRRRWRMVSSPRIGISQGIELPYRRFIDGHLLVSGRAADHSVARNWRFGSGETD